MSNEHNTIFFEINGHRRTAAVPTTWNALELRDLYACYAIIQSNTPLWVDAHEVIPAKRLLLLQYFLQLSAADMAAWQEDCRNVHGEEEGDLIFFGELGALLPAVDGFFDILPATSDAPELWQIRLGLTRCPYPELKHPEFEWYGPADGLDNLTIYELGTVFALFEEYITTQSEDAALRLIATIYRPAKKASRKNMLSAYQGDIRLPFQHHEATVAQRLPHVQELPLATRQLILFWVAGCYHAIIQDNPNIFERPEDDPDGIAGERVGNDYGWAAIIMSLAGDITKIDDVASKSWTNVFTYLSFLEDERKKQEIRAAKAAAAAAH